VGNTQGASELGAAGQFNSNLIIKLNCSKPRRIHTKRHSIIHTTRSSCTETLQGRPPIRLIHAGILPITMSVLPARVKDMDTPYSDNLLHLPGHVVLDRAACREEDGGTTFRNDAVILLKYVRRISHPLPV
jgi:hypothetical protein